MGAALKLEAQTNVQKHEHKHEHAHDHNCETCHEHTESDKKNSTRSAIIELHKNNGHKCTDGSCPIDAPHGHIKAPKKEAKAHDHDHSKCNHDHSHDHKDEDKHDHKHDQDHKHHHHDHKFPIWPLEDFVAHAKVPKWLRETLLNASFLSPAMITSELVEKAPIPKLFKTWLAITSMHAVNRGKQKLPRLGLTYLISGAASAGSETALGAKLSRFLATSAVAFVEKFSSNGHHHDPETMEQMIKREISTLAKNIKSKKQWAELLPSLINIEAKVQLVAPLINYGIEKMTENLSDTSKSIISTIGKIISTSLGFVGLDKVLTTFAQKAFGENSAFAASLSSVCGCCGSPVCSAAATDTALSNSM